MTSAGAPPARPSPLKRQKSRARFLSELPRLRTSSHGAAGCHRRTPAAPPTIARSRGSWESCWWLGPQRTPVPVTHRRAGRDQRRPKPQMQQQLVSRLDRFLSVKGASHWHRRFCGDDTAGTRDGVLRSLLWRRRVCAGSRRCGENGEIVAYSPARADGRSASRRAAKGSAADGRPTAQGLRSRRWPRRSGAGGARERGEGGRGAR